jgi:hypothetical protein
MRKLGICTVIVVATAALLLSSAPVMAKTERTYFEGTWCRTGVAPTGITKVFKNGKLMRREGNAFFDVFTDDPRVTGEFEIYDVFFNIGPFVPVDCPVAKDNAFSGHVQANFTLTPDPDSEISGTWEGRFEFKYSIEDGCHYGRLTANGHGTGDLEGLKLRVYAEHEFYDIACTNCDANAWPYMVFNGYILAPASVDGE